MAKPILSDRVIFERDPIDPNEFADRCASAVNLLRALAIGANSEMHCYNFRLDEWDIHHSCMGVADLLETLQVDLTNHFAKRSEEKPRKTGKPVAGAVDNTRAAAEEAKPAAMPPLSPRSKRAVNELLAELVYELSNGREKRTASPESADSHNGSGESAGESAQH